MSDQGCSDSDQSKRDIPSFIEPRPPLISNPFMRPRPQKGMNLLELFEEDSESEEPELVQVYLRLKPCNVRNNLYEVKSDRCLITSVDTATAGHGRRTQHNVSKMYTFSHIFGPESNQKEIFEHVVKENLKKLPDGHNFTLLTYGASGSGKTYTLMGTVASPGLVPRSLEYVFRVVDAAQQPLYKPAEGGADKLGYAEQTYELQWVKRLRHVSAPLRDKYRRMSAQLRNDLTVSTLDLANRTRYYVWVSFVEIYNEAIYDLLSNNDRSKATSKLRIREDSSGNVYVKGATQAFVRTGEEAYDVMVAGKHNLQVAATGVHAHSSRSHCIFTITMLTETEGGVRSAFVRLCDLAGSERARQTRNTGARMLESRAINSSLHVLERCLHMLRRKQRQRVDATLVPYRESKLTRLLGAGLSGARGEAVSMVVTLNPAPEYAHETRHVLQLAAVAKDIQVNQTIAESILESTQDTTVECSAEMMKLRADNERLHFELIQAQTRNKDLMAAMAEKQQEVAKTMFEIVEEAKDMTRQYYEARLQSLRTEMEEMKEEYEFRLKAAAASTEIRLSSDAVGTPSRSLQIKVAQLTTEIAILKEQLAAEKLAQARAEEELHHLRACIEERDEKAEGTSENEEVVLTDSESEEEDICNESLEPTFKKDDINQSRLLQKSLTNEIGDGTRNNDVTSDSDNNTIEQGHGDHCDSILEKSGDTLKDLSFDKLDKDVSGLKEHKKRSNDKDKSVTSDHDVTEEISDKINDKDDSGTSDKYNLSCQKDVSKEITNKANSQDNNTVNNNSHTEHDNINAANKAQDQNESVKSGNSFVRGTYFVRDTDITKTSIYENAIDVSKAKSRGTYFVKDSKGNDSGNNTRETYESTEDNFADTENSNADFPEKLIAGSAKAAHKHFSKLKISQDSDASLAQFEKLEQDANNRDCDSVVLNTTDEFAKILREKRKYFDDSTELKVTKEKKTYFDDITVPTEEPKLTEIKTNVLDDRSPSIVKEVVASNFEPSTIKKLLGESFTRQPETYASVKKKTNSLDIFDGFDSPNIVTKKDILEPPITAKKSNFLATFEVPKTVSEDVKSSDDKEIQILYVNTQTQSYFDNITTTVNKVDSVESEKAESIFKTCIEKPAVSKIPEIVDIVETTRKSIEKMVLDQKSDKKEKKHHIKIKVERPSIDEDTSNKSLPNEAELVTQIKQENTIDEFENIYKDLTAPRATEFELLISQEINDTQVKEIENLIKEAEIKHHTPHNVSPKQTEADTTRPTPYNLRHKHDTSNNNDEAKNKHTKTVEKKVKLADEILLENIASCQSKNKAPKRNLRLRRRKNQSEEDATENDKLKDIVNLQKEFSDVTMDMPAPHKEVKDIESPEKKEEEENLPPLLGVQSCPSKSVQRSRRKLFTPRAEPLEESLTQTGDSNDKVYVPRPSYHRPRARRKL